MKNVTELHSPERAQRGQQLSLLPPTDAPVRFQLSRTTRERGLRHIAEIREQIAQQRAAARHDEIHRLRPRRPEAA